MKNYSIRMQYCTPDRFEDSNLAEKYIAEKITEQDIALTEKLNSIFDKILLKNPLSRLQNETD